MANVTKTEFETIMKESECGWVGTGACCPSDLAGIGVSEESEHCRGCEEECMKCWKNVLENHNWEE